MPATKQLVGPDGPNRIPDAEAFTGTERFHIVQETEPGSGIFNSRSGTMAQLIAASVGPQGPPGEDGKDGADGAGGPKTIRVLTEEDGAPGAYPLEYFTVYPVLEGDIGNGIMVPFADEYSPPALLLPVVPIGSEVLVIYGDPTEALSGPPNTTPAELAVGAYADEATDISLAIENEQMLVLQYGESATLIKAASMSYFEQTYHIWSVVSRTTVESGGGGGGASRQRVYWDQSGYDVPGEGRYTSFGAAVAALQEAGGGVLEVVGYGGGIYGIYGQSTYNLSDIDVVGAPGAAYRTQLELGDGVILYRARSFQNLTIVRQGVGTGDPCLTYDGGRAVFIDCDVGEAYPFTDPFIGHPAYLELRGHTRLGQGSVIASGGQLTLYAYDTSTVADDAILATTLSAISYGAYISPTQPSVSGGIALSTVGMKRFIPATVDAASSLPLLANRFIEADTSSGGVNIYVSSYAGLDGGSTGANAYVAKRGTGGNVTITGLTYVPGGGTSYVITEENAVVELLWLPGGVQVKP